MLNKRGMRVASNLFHIGVLFVLAGHFVGLLTPSAIYHHVLSTENKQLLAMVSSEFLRRTGPDRPGDAAQPSA